MLGDGELCIQALLGADLHRAFDCTPMSIGSYVQLHAFSLVSKEISQDAQKGSQRLVFLKVEDLSAVGWCGDYVVARGMRRSTSSHDQEATETERVLGDQKTPIGVQVIVEDMISEDFFVYESDDSDDGFEALSAPKKQPSAQDAPDPVPAPAAPAAPAGPMPAPVAPAALPRDWKNPNMPLKLTNLAAIPNLPYKQNWSVNVLAIVASISDVEASTLPPYRQRQVRLADPSTEKHVYLTVFLDPEQFCPKAGSVVLLAGVKNHRFDGGSLKKYVSDRPRNGLSWWYEDPQFPWCPTAELKSWWAAAGDS